MRIDLEPTGERVIEDVYMHSIGAYTIYAMHAASYGFVEKLCSEKKVLDLGCGSGYGAMRLSKTANEVHGVDVAEDAISYAKERFKNANLHFRKIDPSKQLPFATASFDVVLSFQVIEHVSDEDGYLREARRLLKPGGTLVVITPDRKNRLLPGQKPWNRWHLREYDMSTLVKLINRHLTVTQALQMGARREIASIEIKRYSRTKWLCLPATLPGMPDFIRIGALNLVHRVIGKFKPAHSVAIQKFEFDEHDFIIGENQENSLNLVVTAQLAKNARD
ncbi:class I SAM-dependent methyltransferase [Stenotrophomonas terrae]|uniref:class I SAM-dependent methyltransferase n=1 Tax=Stenotrophomonas terrae TaxID=405446 RepID=UPI003208DF44